MGTPHPPTRDELLRAFAVIERWAEAAENRAQGQRREGSGPAPVPPPSMGSGKGGAKKE